MGGSIQGEKKTTEDRLGRHLSCPEACSLQPAARSLFNRRGQHMAEYALVLAVATAAIAGMSTYVRRALQARVKAYTDHYLEVEDNDVSFSTGVEGDFDGNGVIDVQDLSTFDASIMCPQAFCTVTLTPEQRAKADMDGNGVLDAADFLYMGWLYDFSGQYQAGNQRPFGPLGRTDLRLPNGRGDLNGDGEVTPEEAAKVYDYTTRFVRPQAQPVTLSPAELAAADANGDGVVNSDDYDVMWPVAYASLTRNPNMVPGLVIHQRGEETQRLGIEYEQGSDVLPGDLTGDGDVTVHDLVVLAGYLLHTDPLSSQQLDAADVNGDGNIGISDILQIVDITLGNQPTVKPYATSTTILHDAMRVEHSGVAHTGDLNGNGKIDITEILRAINFILGLAQPTPSELAIMDTDGDGQILIFDLIVISDFAIHGIDVSKVARDIIVEANEAVEQKGESLIRGRQQLPPPFIPPKPLKTDLNR